MNFFSLFLLGYLSPTINGLQWVTVEPEGTPLADQGNPTSTTRVANKRSCELYCEDQRNKGTICDSVLYCPNDLNDQDPACTTFGPKTVTENDDKLDANQRCTTMFHKPDLTLGEEVQNNVQEFGGLYAAGVIGGSIVGGLVCLFLSYRAYKSDWLYGRTKSWWNRDSW